MLREGRARAGAGVHAEGGESFGSEGGNHDSAEAAEHVRAFRGTKGRRGITLNQLLACLFFFFVTSFLAFAVYRPSKRATYTAAQVRLSTISLALRMYNHDFGAYPPDNFTGNNSSETLKEFLGKRLFCANGNMSKGRTLPPIFNGTRHSVEPASIASCRKKMGHLFHS